MDIGKDIFNVSFKESLTQSFTKIITGASVKHNVRHAWKHFSNKNVHRLPFSLKRDNSGSIPPVFDGISKNVYPY